MKEIEGFSRKGQRYNEYLAYNREVEAAILKETAEKLKIEEVFAVFQQDLQTFDDSIVYIPGSAFSKMMAESDDTRDDIHIGISEQVRTGLRHFTPAIRTAAEDLMPLVRAFQGIEKKGFDEESGYVMNEVEALRKEPNKTNIATLNLTEWVNQLEIANNVCIKLTSDRTIQQEERANSVRAVEARKKLNASYNQMVKRLNALALVNGDELYASLFDYINGRIAHYRTVLARRPSKKPEE